jgi:hypothetical protein
MLPRPEQVRFWNWFKENGDRVASTMIAEDEEAREQAADELRDAVQQAAQGVVLEVGKGDSGWQLIVSADGKYEHVDDAKDFAASAPALSGWEVIPFRKRDGGDFVIVLEGERVSPGDVWFKVAEAEDGLDLTLFVRGLTPDNRRLRGLGASLLAQHFVGELDTLTMLGSLRIEELPEPPDRDLRPLAELPAVFDAAKSSRYPPPGALPALDDTWINLSGTINGAVSLILLHAGLRPMAGHPDYDRRLTVSIPYEADEQGLPATSEEYQAVCTFGDQLSEALQEGEQSLLALTVTGRGRRDLVFYTSHAGAALLRLEDQATDEAPYRFKTAIEHDTFWGMFRSFLDAAEQQEEQEEQEE